MSVVDQLKVAEKRLSNYYEAEQAVLAGQSFTMGTRSLTRADLGEIRKAIKELEIQCSELKAKARGKGRRMAFRPILKDE